MLGSRATGQGQRNDWWRSIINALLEELDGGQHDNTGVIVVGASNHPEMIDPAILRSGRLEERITLHPPGAEALAAIYRDELGEEAEPDLDYPKLGRISLGMTGADVIKICKSARRLAYASGRRLRHADVIAAITGPSEAMMGNAARMRVALHEAGHAIAALASPALRLEHVSLIPHNNRAGGAALGLTTAGTVTAAVLDDYLVALLAGRAAKEVLLGEVSGGAGGPAHSDLGRATNLAAEAELALGLGSERLIWYAPLPEQTLTDLLTRRPDLAHSVQTRLTAAYQTACALIRARATQIRALANHLLAMQVLSGAEIAALLQTTAMASPAETP